MKITHVMSDGTERETIEGFKVPNNEHTADAYKVLAEITDRLHRKNCENKGKDD